MKIDTATLETLQQLEVQGNNVRIQVRLGRSEYQAVDRVLQAIGGKWNRRAQAHVFKDSPVDAIDRAVATGVVTTAADEGFFATPGKLATELVRQANVRHGDVVLEPSAGDGALVFAALEQGANVIVVERNGKRRATLALNLGLFTERPMSGDHPLREMGTQAMVSSVDDFMRFTGIADWIRPNRVLMNPPFCRVGIGNHLDHVRLAYDHMQPSDASGAILVSVLPQGVMFRQDARHRDFRSWVSANGGEFDELPEGSFRESGTDVRTVTLRMSRRS